MKIPIQPYIIELNPNNITETIEAINDKSEQYDINTIFLSCSSEQRMEITREISSDSIMFFYLGNVEGEDCEGNVIYVFIYFYIYIYIYIIYLINNDDK